MREILFRGKRIDNGEWVEGSAVISYQQTPDTIYVGQSFIVTGFFNIRDRSGERVDFSKVEVKPSTLCQFTGLRDKNGEGIWEGDILKMTTDEMVVLIGAVEYHGTGFYLSDDSDLYEIDFFHSTEVIGSIHDKEQP